MTDTPTTPPESQPAPFGVCSQCGDELRSWDDLDFLLCADCAECLSVWLRK